MTALAITVDEGEKLKNNTADGADIASLTDMISKLALSIQALKNKNRAGPPQAAAVAPNRN